jgi:phage tail sheath gpL-like
MKLSRLTVLASPATSFGMRSKGTDWSGRSGMIAKAGRAAVLITGTVTMAGCISVNAPDKPIVIELNINIKQEVIYRLAEDVKQNIEANPDIF